MKRTSRHTKRPTGINWTWGIRSWRYCRLLLRNYFIPMLGCPRGSDLNVFSERENTVKMTASELIGQLLTASKQKRTWRDPSDGARDICRGQATLTEFCYLIFQSLLHNKIMGFNSRMPAPSTSDLQHVSKRQGIRTTLTYTGLYDNDKLRI